MPTTFGYRDSIYAGGVATLITAKDITEHEGEAPRNSGWVKRILESIFLELNGNKAANIVLSPNLLPQGIYGRPPVARLTSTRKRLRELCERVARETPAGLFGTGVEESPQTPAGTISVLGVQLDHRLQLDGQFEHLMNKARVRRGILTRISGCAWGMEVGLLSTTPDAWRGAY